MTDIGMIRKKNEDSIGYDSALGLIVLADGMGVIVEEKLQAA